MGVSAVTSMTAARDGVNCTDFMDIFTCDSCHISLCVQDVPLLAAKKTAHVNNRCLGFDIDYPEPTSPYTTHEHKVIPTGRLELLLHATIFTANMNKHIVATDLVSVSF